jgi:hypothetical protein
VISSNRTYYTKMELHTNRDLKEYKKDPNFRAYMGEEGFVIEVNYLNMVVPETVGFLDNVIPKAETLSMHHERLTQFLPENSPVFQVALQKIYGKDGKQVITVMIQTDGEDVYELNHMLIKASKIGWFGYFPFAAFNCMLPGKKHTTINSMNDFHLKYRSVNLEGFKDFNDDIVMFTKGKDDVGSDNILHKKLTTTTVSDYLRKAIKAANGENLFLYVYPPSAEGIRETLCKCDNHNDAKEFSMVMPSELARNMNKKSIRMVFEDPVGAINGMTADPWVPYARVTSIVDSTSIKSGSYKKRIRLGGDDNTETGSIKLPHSPSSSTIKSNTLGSGSSGQQTTYLNATVQSFGGKQVTSTTRPEVIVINEETPNEIDELKKTVKIMEAQMSRMTTLEKDIRDVAQGVVNMGDNIVLNNEILKLNITSDIKNNIDQSTIRNNEALIVSMSKLMSEQTAQIETRMDTKCEQNDKMYESLQEALDKKLEKTTRNLKKLLDTTDTSRKVITKHQSKHESQDHCPASTANLLMNQWMPVCLIKKTIATVTPARQKQQVSPDNVRSSRGSSK